MKDERAMGRLVINKKDADSKEALAGVEFTLTEKETGKEAAKLVTDKNGRAESDLLPIGTYANGSFKEKTVYILKETKALEGYEKSEEEWEITFDYKDDKTPVIEVLKEIQNKKTPDEPHKVTDMPKTGDNTNLLLAFLLLGVSAGCVAFVLTRKRKHRK